MFIALLKTIMAAAAIGTIAIVVTAVKETRSAK